MVPAAKAWIYAIAILLFVFLFVCSVVRLSPETRDRHSPYWSSCYAAVSSRSAAGPVRPMSDTRTVAAGAYRVAYSGRTDWTLKSTSAQCPYCYRRSSVVAWPHYYLGWMDPDAIWHRGWPGWGALKSGGILCLKSYRLINNSRDITRRQVSLSTVLETQTPTLVA